MSDFLKGIKFPGIDKVYKIPQSVSDLQDKDQYVTKSFLGDNSSFSGTGTVARIDGTSSSGKIYIDAKTPVAIVGKNFLKPLYEVENVITQRTQEGVTVEMFEDGTLRLNGTVNEGQQWTLFQVSQYQTFQIPEGRFIFSGFAPNNPGVELRLTHNYSGACYILENNKILTFSNNDGLVLTADYPNGPYELSLYVPEGIVLDNYIIRPQLELLLANKYNATSYEPYIGGEDYCFNPGEGYTYGMTNTTSLYSLNTTCPFTWYYCGNNNNIYKNSQLINDTGYIDDASVSIADFGTAVLLKDTKESGIIKVETEADQVIINGKNLIPFFTGLDNEENLTSELYNNNSFVINGRTYDNSPMLSTEDFQYFDLPKGRYIFSRNLECVGLCEVTLESDQAELAFFPGQEEGTQQIIIIDEPQTNCFVTVYLNPDTFFQNVPINIQLEVAPEGVDRATEFVPYHDDVITYDAGAEITPVEGGTTIFASDLTSEVKCRYIGGRQAIHKTSQLENDAGFLTRDEIIALIQEMM